MTIETTDQEDIGDWSRSRPRIVLVNRDVNPSPTANDLSPELVERLGGARPDFLVASRDELDRIGIVLAHDQFARFRNGEPVLIVAGRVDHREALKRGRRQKEELERQVQDALAVQTYAGIERLCAWMRLRDGRRLNVTVPELRERAIALLAADAWLDDPNASGRANEEDRCAFFRTQADTGSRLVADWYAWAARPDDVSRAAQEAVAVSAQNMDHPLIVEAIDHEIGMVGFMLRCLRQVTTLVLTAHAMSAEVRKNDRMTKGQQAVLAGAASDRPTLYEAARAALDGDFNPAELFPALLSYHGMLELARLIGRRGRNHDIRLEPDLVREMQRQIRIRETFEAEQAQQPGQMPFDEQAAALVITQAAWEIVSRNRWPAVLDAAVETDSAVTLTVRR